MLTFLLRNPKGEEMLILSGLVEVIEKVFEEEMRENREKSGFGLFLKIREKLRRPSFN